MIEAFRKEYVEDWDDLQREFETKKRCITPGEKIKVTLTISMALAEILQSMTKKSIADVIKQNKEFEGKLACVSCRLRIDHAVVKSWLKESCENTVQRVRDLLIQKEFAGTQTILLVGGFSNSAMLQDAMRNSFHGKRVIVSEEGDLAALKGAVIFGHEPWSIVSRASRCTLGVRVFRDFVDEEHPQEKRVTIDGRVKCKDIL